MTPRDILTALRACDGRSAIYTRFKTPGRAYNHLRHQVLAGDAHANNDFGWLLNHLLGSIIEIRCSGQCTTCDTVGAMTLHTIAELLPWEIIKVVLQEVTNGS